MDFDFITVGTSAMSVISQLAVRIIGRERCVLEGHANASCSTLCEESQRESNGNEESLRTETVSTASFTCYRNTVANTRHNGSNIQDSIPHNIVSPDIESSYINNLESWDEERLLECLRVHVVEPAISSHEEKVRMCGVTFGVP